LTFVYNTTLAFFYAIFFFFTDESHVGGSDVACEVVAAVAYWLLLICILLSIFQALRILKIFAWTVTMEKCIIALIRESTVYGVSFGLPTVLGLLIGLLDTDFYRREDEL